MNWPIGRGAESLPPGPATLTRSRSDKHCMRDAALHAPSTQGNVCSEIFGLLTWRRALSKKMLHDIRGSAFYTATYANMDPNKFETKKSKQSTAGCFFHPPP